MEAVEYLYSGNEWFKRHLVGPEASLWRRARKLFLFNRNLSSALNVFKFDYKAIKSTLEPEGVVLTGSRNTTLNPDENTPYRPGQTWTDDAKNSVRTLIDCIATLWKPEYLSIRKIHFEKLHKSLTPIPLQFVCETYDKTDDDVETFNVDGALEIYQNCLAPLHYHELWSEVVTDFKNVDVSLAERETIIDLKLFYDKTTLDEECETALIFGTNRVTFIDNYKSLSKKPGLFDLVLIRVTNKTYFGIIVHVEQNKVKVASEKENLNNNCKPNTNQNELQFELHTTIGIYVSRDCSNAIQQYQNSTQNYNLAISKLSNITSSRRMISAIHNLNQWPQYRSLLKPTIEDMYYQLPEDYDPMTVNVDNKFNKAQSKVISIAEHMFDDIQDHLYMVHGPPGTGKSRTIAGIVLKLLSKLPESGRKQKILLCAPSNNACDELTRRILEEFKKQDICYKSNTLVRIGCQPPDDFRLCDHFLDFMILQEIVTTLKTNLNPNKNIATEIEGRILKHAKIIISTLNYCGSTRLFPLKNNTGFVIIDEASQSLEADLLLPLRFQCAKIMLVGDPLQLKPCVLSDAGKHYGLSQSLYARLYSIFKPIPNGPISMLDTQYRMHPDICQFPSKYFYGNCLSTHHSVAERMIHYQLKPLHLYNMVGYTHDCDEAGSSFNRGEALFIRNFCALLIRHLFDEMTTNSSGNEDDDEDEDINDDGDDDDDESTGTPSSNSILNTDNNSNHEEATTTTITERQPLPARDPRWIEVQKKIVVITPYKAQVRLLRSYLPPYIEIMTADSSQGKEKDIVILSCVRSGDNIGFLDDMHRVNVMLTRSKYGLYVIGNLSQLSIQHACWKELLNHAKYHNIVRDADVNFSLFDLPYRD